MATFTIVHGGWGGGWEWRDVEMLLRARGHDVTRPTLTGLGERAHLLSPSVDLDTHVEDVVRHLEFEGLEDVVLCGHSYGGMVVTGVVDGVPARVTQLVYVDAFVPRDGESLLDLLPAEWASMVRDSATEGRVPQPGEGQGPAYPPWYVERVRDHPLAAFAQPLRLSGRGDAIPRSYIRCLQSDAPVARSIERARRAGWTMLEIAAHHDAQVDDPVGLAELLSAAAS